MRDRSCVNKANDTSFQKTTAHRSPIPKVWTGSQETSVPFARQLVPDHSRGKPHTQRNKHWSPTCSRLRAATIYLYSYRRDDILVTILQ
jgi:hypothetical protein